MSDIDKRIVKKELEYQIGCTFLDQLRVSESGISSPEELGPDDRIPDLWFEYNSVESGLEATELLFGENKQGKAFVHVEGGSKKVIEKLRDLWENADLPKMGFQLIFDMDHHVSNNATENISQDIFLCLKNHIPEVGAWYRMPNDFLHVPKGLRSFLIERLNPRETSDWHQQNSTWPPNIEVSQIIDRIESKEEKLDAYRAVRKEIWLIMWYLESRLSGMANTPDDLIHHQYKFSFDRVFIFDALRCRYWELIKEDSEN